MDVWEYLTRRAERMEVRREREMHLERLWQRVTPSDFRSWLGAALFCQSSGLFGLLAIYPHLSEDQGFLTLASAVIVTGWIGGAAAFAYSAGKSSSEQRENTGKLLDLMHRREGDRPAGTPEDPLSVAGATPGHEAVETRTASAGSRQPKKGETHAE